MPNQRQKAERIIWKQVKGTLDVPSAQDNMAEYRAMKRKIEKLSQNPEFVKGFLEKRMGVAEFLQGFNLNVASLDFFDHYIFETNIYIRKPKKK